MTSSYWSPVVRDLAPYVPGEQPRGLDIVKLNTNENPYPPSPRVLAAVRGAADERLRLYPPPEADDLKAVIADYHGLEVDQVFVGNGSDEVLAHALTAEPTPIEWTEADDLASQPLPGHFLSEQPTAH